MRTRREIWDLGGLRIFESEDRYASRVHEEIVKTANISGSGFLAFEAAKYANLVVSYDLSDELLGYVKRRIRETARNVLAIKGDAMALPFAEGSFDVLLAGWILHELPDRQEALKEWVRVLKMGGTIVVGDKKVPEDRSFFDFKLSDTDFFATYGVRKEHFDSMYIDATEHGFSLGQVSTLFKEARLRKVRAIPWRRFYLVCFGAK